MPTKQQVIDQKDAELAEKDKVIKFLCDLVAHDQHKTKAIKETLDYAGQMVVGQYRSKQKQQSALVQNKKPKDKTWDAWTWITDEVDRRAKKIPRQKTRHQGDVFSEAFGQYPELEKKYEKQLAKDPEYVPTDRTFRLQAEKRR